MYAMDMETPLRLYDCLVPEIEAYRPQRLNFRTKWEEEDHIEAKLKLAKYQWRLVSVLTINYRRQANKL